MFFLLLLFILGRVVIFDLKLLQIWAYLVHNHILVFIIRWRCAKRAVLSFHIGSCLVVMMLPLTFSISRQSTCIISTVLNGHWSCIKLDCCKLLHMVILSTRFTAFKLVDSTAIPLVILTFSFHFINWDHVIDHDICLAHTIYLLHSYRGHFTACGAAGVVWVRGF